MALVSTTHSDGLFDWMRDAKSMGAYYTDVQDADFLAWWAIRSPLQTMLDPAFGEGVFLRSGSERLTQLGGRPENQVYGAEIDSPVFDRTSDRMVRAYALNRKHLIHADFFSIDPQTLKVDVAIGNPPFIRYQRFTGAMRKLALFRCAAQGVRLPEL
ncbi:MAG: N-6 DNA methylase [Isosphaeraceae bacterium]